MDLWEFERQAREYARRRCREHVQELEKVLNRPITFDYRYEHTRTTAAIAGRLAEKLGVEPALARIAAWLHDLGKCRVPGLEEEANQEREQDHGHVGAEEAAAFLESIAFPRDLTQQVRQAIAQHVGLVKDHILEEPLAALLWDADKLSKLSFAGVLHYLVGEVTTGAGIVDCAAFLQGMDWELHRGIRDSLNTEIARRWADRELAETAGIRDKLLAAMED
ncbi:MAG: HD domain-containing protein [Firmicutes bacterium]|jgi:putative nucleotidyltransferase with HDIG domain|nr:HD domain-containing protein [Bacillota bacterium]HOB35830.1 HD domain-containing protein [Bacillota bacterium]HPZ90455.1 HD domain-containing protein [Bacillota bacterium]HQE02727.1 HD domain-containing protein [Bacillota bacterium]